MILNLADKFFKMSAEMTDKPIKYNDKVLLIDGLNTYLRAFAATPTMNEDGEHMGGITGFLLSVGAAIRMHRPSRVVICFDGKGGSQRRRAMFEDYKANRRTMVKLNRTYDFGTLDREKESQKWQLIKLVEMLRCLPLTVMAPENVEADDVIAYLAQVTEERGGKAIILSTDKDFLQMVNENISVWNPVKKKMYTPESVVEDYGFHPNNFVIYRAVTGDDSDGIPGIRGIAEKTLLKLLPVLATGDKCSLETLETGMHSILSEKKPPKAAKLLLDGMDIVKRNLDLMRLDEVAMSGNTRLNVLNEFDKPLTKIDKFALTKLVNESKLMSAFGNWDTWIINTFFPLARFIEGK